METANYIQLIEQWLPVIIIILGYILGKKFRNFVSSPTLELVRAISGLVFNALEDYKLRAGEKASAGAIKTERRKLVIEKLKEAGKRPSEKAIQVVINATEAKFRKEQRSRIKIAEITPKVSVTNDIAAAVSVGLEKAKKYGY